MITINIHAPFGTAFGTAAGAATDSGSISAATRT